MRFSLLKRIFVAFFFVNTLNLLLILIHKLGNQTVCFLDIAKRIPKWAFGKHLIWTGAGRVIAVDCNRIVAHL